MLVKLIIQGRLFQQTHVFLNREPLRQVLISVDGFCFIGLLL